MAQSDLQDVLDQVTDILCDAYTPEATREDMAGAIGDALDLLDPDGSDDDDGDDYDDDTAPVTNAGKAAYAQGYSDGLDDGADDLPA